MPEDWWSRGACRDMDLKLFFNNEFPAQPNPEAVRACAQCPVQAECYTHAIHKEDHGFWAGTTETERRKIRKAAGITLEQHRPFDIFISTHGTPTGYQRHRRNGEPACDACKEARNTFRHGYIQMRMPV